MTYSIKEDMQDGSKNLPETNTDAEMHYNPAEGDA